MTAVYWGDGQVFVTIPWRCRLLCPTEDLSLTPELALYDDYEAAFVAWLGEQIKPGMTVVDVGANLGLFTVLTGALVGRTGRVVAYEPNPVLVPWLQRNVSLNWMADRVEVVAKAAHREAGTRTLRVPRRFMGGGSIEMHAWPTVGPIETDDYEVECVPVAVEGFVDLLKVDVEGGEAAVLEGLRPMLDERRIGAMALEHRIDLMDDAITAQACDALATLRDVYGARFGVPGSPDEVTDLAVAYEQLLVLLPGATVGLSAPSEDG